MLSIMTSTRALILLLVLISVPNTLSSVDVSKTKKDEEAYLSHEYSEMNKKFKNFVSSNLKSVLRFLGEESQEFNISTKCRGNALRLLLGLRDLKLSAVSFIDAAGKLGDGFLSGNFQMLGNYDQCMNSTVLKKTGGVDFKGRYCLITSVPYLPNPKYTPDTMDQVALVTRLSKNLTEMIRTYLIKSALLRIKPDKFGLCVPSGCEKHDVQQITQYASKQVTLNFTVDFCETVDDLIYFSPRRIVLTCVYSFFILLLLVGSAIDQYSKMKKIKFENPIIRIFLCFSIITNFKKFSNLDVADKNLSCLNGVRVLSLFYVILGHHYLLKAESYMLKNVFLTFGVWVKEFLFQIILNGIYTVDVFFFIGGFLNCYIRAKKNYTNFSLSSTFMGIVHRIFRLYPIILSIYILFFMFNFRGPMAHSVNDRFQEPCVRDWWKNLLFVNNFFRAGLTEQCLPHLWYLCCDMQLFLVSLITIPLLFKKPKAGILLNSAVIFFSIVGTAVRVYLNRSPPTLVFSAEISERAIADFMHNFQSPFTHSASYFGGALLGFLVTKKTSIKVPKIAQVFGWIIASTMFCTALFMTKRWNAGTRWTRLGSALYFSISRPMYSWSVGWLIFCCITGHGGIINYLLSMKLWIPLNRLCLTMYLTSAMLQSYFYGNLTSPMETQTDIEIWGYFGDIAVSFLVSLPLVFLFESPFIALEKIIFHGKENTAENKENEMKEKDITQNGNAIKNDDNISSIKI